MSIGAEGNCGEFLNIEQPTEDAATGWCCCEMPLQAFCKAYESACCFGMAKRKFWRAASLRAGANLFAVRALAALVVGLEAVNV